MPIPSENIARGLVIGAQIGNRSKKKFQDLLEKNRNRLDYQRFQLLQQKNAQAFQETEALKARRQRWEIFKKNYSLANRAENRAEATSTKQDRVWERQKTQAEREWAFKLFQEDSNLMQRDIESTRILLRQEVGKNESADIERIAALEQEVAFKENAFKTFINTEGKRFDFIQRGKTLSELMSELEAKRLARIEQSSREFQRLFPEGILPDFGTPEGALKATEGFENTNKTYPGMLRNARIQKANRRSIERLKYKKDLKFY